MLSRDQAQTQLKQFQSESYAAQRQAGIARLPHKLRAISEPLTHAIPYWSLDQKQRAALEHAYAQLDSLKPREREKLFRLFFPKFAAQLEAAWQLQKCQPYHFCHPFRAPHHPEFSKMFRSGWLHQLILVTQQYDQDLVWFAAWTPYLGGIASQVMPPLFAAALNGNHAEGGNVFDVLTASAKGEHEIGAMGQHVIMSLLMAARPEGWAFVESLLLAAQRQEGLRQAILECVARAHPEAFRRLLRLILENDLIRFSAVTRAVDVWLGMQWDVENTRVVFETLAQLLELLEQPLERKRAVGSNDPTRVYLALWVMAHEDAVNAVKPASQLLKEKRVGHRFVAVHFLTKLHLEPADRALMPALADSDLRVALRAIEPFAKRGMSEYASTDMFERIEKLLTRLDGKKKSFEPLVWEWVRLESDPQVVSRALVNALGKRSPKRLLAHLNQMDVGQRIVATTLLGEAAPRDAQARRALLDRVGDASHHVRREALRVLEKQPVNSAEAQSLEAWLTRQADDLRRGVLTLLLQQDDQAVLTSAARLWYRSNVRQREASLELLREMLNAERSVDQCRECARQFQADARSIGTSLQPVLCELLAPPKQAATLDDALGLMNTAERTKPLAPRSAQVLRARFNSQPLVTPAAAKLIHALDALVEQQRTETILTERYDVNREELLGNAGHGFPLPQVDLDREQNRARLPLDQVWRTWYETRAAELRDADGLEILRAQAAVGQQERYWDKDTRGWRKDALQALFVNAGECKYRYLVKTLLTWLDVLYPAPNAPDFMLDAIEYTFALVPPDEFSRQPDPERWWNFHGWRDDAGLLGWLELAREHRRRHPGDWSGPQHTRFYQLLRWMDEPVENVGRYRPPLREVLTAYSVGGATDADVYDQLLGPREKSNHWYRQGFGELRTLTRRKTDPLLDDYPFLRELVARGCQRILDIELARGEMPTAASNAALAIESLQGAATLARLLNALRRDELMRSGSYDSTGKATVLSHLIRVTFPAPEDSNETFAQAMREANVSQTRLIELAVYAPQWAGFVEHALGWHYFAEGVWWIHAHTKDNNWRVDHQIRETWNAQATERTPLTSQDLLEGAVDVAWFQHVYNALGSERWNALYEAAKYASSAIGHARARQFADAMLGKLEREALVKRLLQKRHQDSVRALGLMPLPEGAEREPEVMERYRVLQEFARGSRKFGALRQQSEKLATRIGMDNLARTAGYSDPLRLEWAMEARNNADLENGISLTRGEAQVSLNFAVSGRPQLTVTKGEKELKAIPAALKRDPEVVALQARKRELEQQLVRMRASLEQAMCRGDTFTPDELATFLKHPLLRGLVARLLFTNDEVTGFVAANGRVLQTHLGERVVLASDARVRLAHPYDLYQQKVWHEWQRECFVAERIQPFKQIFRELYVLTSVERDAGTLSPRYAGNQVNTRQALALFGRRGWIAHPAEGVRKTFHDENLAAWVDFRQGIATPAEVEGWTIDNVWFTRRGEWKQLPLTEIPLRVFSEVMRDLDLVVSVAHAGGVDPETSASTVEMRAALLRETCALLRLGNVEINGTHAVIAGRVGNYTVHLGSGVAHKQPGGVLCIVAVPAAQRGRLFLPFADDDPKTAEVISKVLLLANDTQIQDPVILAQIVG